MRISKGKPVFGRKDTVDYTTIAEIIHAWLVKFRDDYVKLELYSVPCDLADEYGDDAQAKYVEIMDKMIYAFADVEPEYSGKIWHKTGEPDERGFIPFNIEVSDEDAWEQYMEDMREHERKVGEGLELFGKYFRSLWV